MDTEGIITICYYYKYIADNVLIIIAYFSKFDYNQKINYYNKFLVNFVSSIAISDFFVAIIPVIKSYSFL